MGLARIKDKLYNCEGCSQCYGRGPYIPWADAMNTIPEWTCPALEQFKMFSYTARGKQYLAREVALGNYPITDELIQIFYSDPGCGLCASICPQPSLEILRAMREEIAERGRLPEPNRKLDENIKERHNIFGAQTDRRGDWAKEFGLPKKGETIYFAGCYASYRQPEIAKAVVKVLRAANIDVAYLAEDEWCCGLHSGWSSQKDIEIEMAQHNLEVIRDCGAKRVILSCAGCYSAFKTDYLQMGNKYDFEVMHIVELLARLIQDNKLKIRQHGDKKKVTYHDPCFLGREHLGRRIEIYKEPRKVINDIPGVELVEMEHNGRWSYCCGGGASVVSASYPEVTKYMSRKRVLEAYQVSSTLLTTCPRCLENFRHAAQEDNLDISIQDLTSFLAGEMGL